MSITDKLSILERLPSYQRMAARDNAGKSAKKTKKTKKSPTHEHFQKDWDKDLWD
jgi:hypothetical protein